MATPTHPSPASFWNERYASDGFAYGTEPNDFLRQQAHLFAPGGRIACLAEGEGRNAVYLAQLGLDVVAIDVSEVGLAKAARLAADRGVAVTTQLTDLAQWNPEPAGLDAVVSIWAHLPSSVRREVHARIGQALKPGGILVLEAYTPAQLAHGTGGPRDAALMMTAESLREELRGLELVLLEERVREIHEGPWHDGLSAVVQCVARRPETRPG